MCLCRHLPLCWYLILPSGVDARKLKLLVFQPLLLPDPRKVYSCRICGQAMSKQTSHTQFKGKCYCPEESGQVSEEEWLAQQKTEAAAKGAPQQPYPPPPQCPSASPSVTLHERLHMIIRYHTSPYIPTFLYVCIFSVTGVVSTSSSTTELIQCTHNFR